jgi:hypothetical protein
MIDELTIQKIKDTANIVDVIGDFYELRKRGVEYECACPFHEDKHIGNFKISPRKNFAKCFACGWQGGPIDFIMEHEKLSFPDAIRWLGKKYCIDCEGADKFDVKPAQRREIPQLPMLVLPKSIVTRTEAARDANRLVVWLSSVKWDKAQRDRIYEVLRSYHIGHSKYGHTIFWQIDEQGRVRTGKMMLYKPDGHRDKDAPHNFDWIHSALYRDYRNPYSADKTDMKQCLFGMHLLNAYRKVGIEQEVCIVESEKTAVLMAIAYGNTCKQVWMACGGVENLSREKLKPIIEQHRTIHLYPDRDGIDAWKRKAEQLRYKKIYVDVYPVTKWWQEEDGDKADIADVVVRMIQSRKPDRNIIEEEPIRILNKRLELEKV